MDYKNKGLLDQIQSANTTTYKELTEKDIRKFMKQMELRDTQQPRDNKGKFIKGPRISKNREYVMYVNQQWMNEFDKQLKEEANKEWK